MKLFDKILKIETIILKKKTIKAFSLLELLVVISIIGVISAISYPSITKWVADREVRKEVYDVVSFIRDRKSDVSEGKFGMIQVLLKPNMETYTMSNQNFFNVYKSISTNNTYKSNKVCDYGYRQNGFSRDNSREIKLSVSNNDSNVHVYPNAAHNPVTTGLCITKDGSIKFMRSNITERDPSTGKNVDVFVFCSKQNTDQYSCKLNSGHEYRYKIWINRFAEIKILKFNKNKNSWVSFDG